VLKLLGWLPGACRTDALHLVEQTDVIGIEDIGRVIGWNSLCNRCVDAICLRMSTQYEMCQSEVVYVLHVGSWLAGVAGCQATAGNSCICSLGV
jgi:hypothetical protein